MNNNHSISEVLYRINVGTPIKMDLLEDAFTKIINNEVDAREIQLGALLTGIMARGPSEEEIYTLMKTVFKIDSFDPSTQYHVDLPDGKKLVGAIGSGKKGVKTMNISTPALITAASCGAYTAKSVSPATSSITGSSDFLREIGFNLDLEIDEMDQVIKETGFGAFDISKIIPKFDKIYCGKFYAPHALSFGLPAIASPIEYDDLLYGIAHPNIKLSAHVLKRFGIKNAMIVSSTHDKIHYLDEMGIYGTTKIVGIRNGEIDKVTNFQPTEELHIACYTPDDIIEGSTIEENINYSIKVLGGKGKIAREDVICINSGTVLYLSRIARNLKEGYEMSKNSIREGKPLLKLFDAIEASKGDIKKLKRYV